AVASGYRNSAVMHTLGAWLARCRGDPNIHSLQSLSGRDNPPGDPEPALQSDDKIAVGIAGNRIDEGRRQPRLSIRYDLQHERSTLLVRDGEGALTIGSVRFIQMTGRIRKMDLDTLQRVPTLIGYQSAYGEGLILRKSRQQHGANKSRQQYGANKR